MLPPHVQMQGPSTKGSNLGPFVLRHKPSMFLPSAHLSMSLWADLAFPEVPSLGI